LNFVEWNY